MVAPVHSWRLPVTPAGELVSGIVGGLCWMAFDEPRAATMSMGSLCADARRPSTGDRISDESFEMNANESSNFGQCHFLI